MGIEKQKADRIHGSATGVGATAWMSCVACRACNANGALVTPFTGPFNQSVPKNFAFTERFQQ